MAICLVLVLIGAREPTEWLFVEKKLRRKPKIKTDCLILLFSDSDSAHQVERINIILVHSEKKSEKIKKSKKKSVFCVFFYEKSYNFSEKQFFWLIFFQDYSQGLTVLPNLRFFT
jgi:hypothetical protein